ncbi:hypothetical protein ACLB2K_056821 [Fragaria x ananassa]
MATSSDQIFFNNCLLCLYLIGPPTFISLRFLQAPYGKHNRPGWGPTISPPLAWFLMESPTLWLTLLLFPYGQHSTNPQALILITLFLLHYINRACLYPLRLHRNTIRKTAPGFPVSVALMAFVFNLLNAYLQSRWVSHYKDYEGDHHGLFWLRFCVGLVVFLGGMSVNVWSDRVLVGLKKEGGGYKIPRGGWFELVSCPNYFGEIVEWVDTYKHKSKGATKNSVSVPYITMSLPTILMAIPPGEIYMAKALFGGLTWTVVVLIKKGKIEEAFGSYSWANVIADYALQTTSFCWI